MNEDAVRSKAYVDTLKVQAANAMHAVAELEGELAVRQLRIVNLNETVAKLQADLAKCNNAEGAPNV